MRLGLDSSSTTDGGTFVLIKPEHAQFVELTLIMRRKLYLRWSVGETARFRGSQAQCETKKDYFELNHAKLLE